MPIVTPGFHGRPRSRGTQLPPGQYLVRDFPVLSAGPTPRVKPEDWEFRIITETHQPHIWDWKSFMEMPAEDFTTDLHCVTKWSKLGTHWRGVSLDVLLAGIPTTAGFALAESYGGYTTNMPLQDLMGGRAWIAYSYDGAALRPEHGGPARLLVPHLYLWKSAKWIRRLRLLDHDEPGFWEMLGYHNYGDPWLEQRYQGD
jgi:DMSO/TMAO reductase YedYZ molybdopterin-dependent catalytic subunit